MVKSIQALAFDEIPEDLGEFGQRAPFMTPQNNPSDKLVQKSRRVDKKFDFKGPETPPGIRKNRHIRFEQAQNEHMGAANNQAGCMNVCTDNGCRIQ